MEKAMKNTPRLFCSIWQLVKNWLGQNDRNHIFDKYTPRISNIPFDEMSKSRKFMKLDITMILHIFKNYYTQDCFWKIPNLKFPRPRIKSNIQYTYKKNRLDKLMLFKKM